MFNVIGQGVSIAFKFCSTALAHPTFLGRAISWGVFYGILYNLAKLVSKVASNVFKNITLPGFEKIKIGIPKSPILISQKESEPNIKTEIDSPSGDHPK